MGDAWGVLTEQNVARRRARGGEEYGPRVVVRWGCRVRRRGRGVEMGGSWEGKAERADGGFNWRSGRARARLGWFEWVFDVESGGERRERASVEEGATGVQVKTMASGEYVFGGCGK
jgi:hypothetical protein